MKTGKDVQKFWLYASDCCLQEIMFDSGESFSRCPRCANLCDWEMVDVAPEEMKAVSESARIAKHWTTRASSMPVALELRFSL
jgi:hypothetical protein